MSPMLYTEHNLEPAPGSCPPDGGPHLSAHWLAAKTAGELQERIRVAVQATGFEWMSYRRVTFRDGVPISSRLFASHANPHWTRLYCEGWYDAVDPHLQHTLRSTLPSAWNVDDTGSWTPHERLTWVQSCYPKLLRSCGIESGVLVALPSDPPSNEHTVFELCSRKQGHEWIDDGVLAHSFMLALCLHDFLTIRMRVLDEAHRDVLISATRGEILRHLARGRSNKEIAHEMQLSSDTVKYHLRELQRHFNVRNRMQLVNFTRFAGER
jgi:DNA-binding CsgD family transcriptional regulator